MRTKKEIWEEVESNLEKGGEYKEDNNLLLFELGLLAFAYFNADEVECNLLWCTFTFGDSYESHESYTITSSNKECFVNGEEVNCSEIANARIKAVEDDALE